MFLFFFFFFFFFFNDTATTEIYTLSLHDALPIYPSSRRWQSLGPRARRFSRRCRLSPSLDFPLLCPPRGLASPRPRTRPPTSSAHWPLRCPRSLPLRDIRRGSKSSGSSSST